MIQSRPGKAQYSESEAAAEVGVSVEELRNLIRGIAGPAVDPEEEPENVKGAMFQQTDLVMLKILARQREP